MEGSDGENILGAKRLVTDKPNVKETDEWLVKPFLFLIPLFIYREPQFQHNSYKHTVLHLVLCICLYYPFYCYLPKILKEHSVNQVDWLPFRSVYCSACVFVNTWEKSLFKRNIFKIELWISLNRIMDIVKSAYLRIISIIELWISINRIMDILNSRLFLDILKYI